MSPGMCIVILERLADGNVGVKHGVSLPSSFNSSNDIRIMLLLVAVDHSHLVDGILVVRDCTELGIWQ